MAIELTKTLQTIEYTDLYFRSNAVYFDASLVVINMDGFLDEGHYTDGFLPIIKKTVVITDAGVLTAFASYFSNPAVAIEAAEDWVVANVAFFTGGSVV